MSKTEISNGKRGGLLKGKPHYDKNGNSLGGIKAVVTDAGGKPVELEGGEVIINKEASKKYWKELSKINQSAGNGVPILPPDGAVMDEDPEEFKDGGNIIEFNPNHLPNKWITEYAESIKKNHPEIWKKGGNIFGNEAFNNLLRVRKRGYWLDSEEWMYIKWRSYVARHKKDFRIEGVVAMLKWCDTVDKGWAYMKNLIKTEIAKSEKKTEKMARGGNTKSEPNSCQILDKNGNPAIDDKSLRKMEKCILKLPQTKDLNLTANGKYKIPRKKLHKKIIDEFKKNAVCITKGQPIAILMGGSPASGKSSFLKKYRPFLLQDEILKVDADEIRAKLPEYKGYNATQTHQETKDIVNTLISDRNIGVPCDFDLIYDGTMNNVRSYKPLIELLRSRNYKIFIVYMDKVPKDVIMQRMKDRYLKTGRFVPAEVVDDFFQKGKSAFEELKPLVDGYMVVDGSNQEYDIIERGGMQLPKDRAYSKLGEKISPKELEKIEYKDGGNIDKKDSVELDIPLMIRIMELAREDIKSDKELHDVAERLIEIRDKGVLTMEDYDFIANLKKKSSYQSLEKKYKGGGNIESTKEKINDLLTKAQIPYQYTVSHKNGSSYWTINSLPYRIADHDKPKSMDVFERYKVGENDFRSYEEFLNFLIKNFDLTDLTKEEEEYKKSVSGKIKVNEDGLYVTPDGRSWHTIESALNYLWRWKLEERNIYKKSSYLYEQEEENRNSGFYADGGLIELLAPNGNPSNLTTEQYKLVRTPEFKAWFGDWENDPENASKVVDENGEPLVVYRGMPKKRKFGNVFKYNVNLFGTKGVGGRQTNQFAFYFTNIKEVAEKYGENISDEEGGWIVKEYFLNVRNLFEAFTKKNEYEITFKKLYDLANKTGKPIYSEDLGNIKIDRYGNPIEFYDQSYEWFRAYNNDMKQSVFAFFVDWNKKQGNQWFWKEYLQKLLGYNGLVFYEESQNIKIDKKTGKRIPEYGNEYSKTYGAFESNQIKLADGTNTTFDGNNPDIRFETGGTVLLAPNGNPSNLTPEQYKLVRTPEFKDWFGDWENDPKNASKVVDENGEPMVVYHGTDAKFNSFNKDFIGSNFKLDKIGFFFTSSYNSANMSRPSYPQKSKFRWTDEDKINAKSGFIIFSFLNIRKPLRLNEVDNIIYDSGVSAINTFDHNRDVITESILRLKKDGFILKKEGEYLLVATQPNQIKLADGTNTTFDPNSDDIRFETGGTIDLASFNKNSKTELKKWDYEHLKTKDEKRKAITHLYAKEYYAKNNIIPLAEPDNEGSMYWQSVSLNDKEYKISFHLYFHDFDNPLKITEANVTFYDEDYNELDSSDIQYKRGGRTVAQTPAPKKDQVYGSQRNAPKSSKDSVSAEEITFDARTLETIENKVREHNEDNPTVKITVATAKAVVRRGMGAYSKSHRPTISGGQPNSRVAWGLARLNAFLYKAVNGRSKSGKYSQDNDLLEELGIAYEKFENGGKVPKKNKGGDCYVVAGRFVINNRLPNGETLEFIGKPHLVHAQVTGQGAIGGLKYGHAWIEDDEYVYDYSNGRELKIPKVVYYKLGQVVEQQPIYFKYTFEEAKQKMRETGHFGSWDLITESGL